jgi:hypothetical protein
VLLPSFGCLCRITVSGLYDSLLYGFMMRRPSGVGSGTGDALPKERYKTIRSGISRRIWRSIGVVRG